MSDIPKVIHYIWVGPQKMPNIVQQCIQSWKENLPEYTIKLWNEDTFPKMSHPYIDAMYQQKKWAFVSDYMRFWILHNEGGIYLDTDMEVLQPFQESFLHNDAFLARTSDNFIACGIIGAVKQSFFIKEILDVYDADTDYSIENTSPKIATRAFTGQKGVKIYEATLFYPCDDGEKCPQKVLAKAYTNHHWAESWVSYAWLRKILRRMGIMNIIKKICKK